MNIVDVVCCAMCINNSMATSPTLSRRGTSFGTVKHLVRKTNKKEQNLQPNQKGTTTPRPYV